jgi:hypothetical protein
MPQCAEPLRGYVLISAPSFQEQARHFQRLKDAQDLLPGFNRSQVTIYVASRAVHAQFQRGRGRSRTTGATSQNERR